MNEILFLQKVCGKRAILNLKRGLTNSGDYKHCDISVEATSGGKEENSLPL